MPLNTERVVEVLDDQGWLGMPPDTDMPWDDPDWVDHEVIGVDWDKTMGRFERSRGDFEPDIGWPDISPNGFVPDAFGSGAPRDADGLESEDSSTTASMAGRRPEICAWYQPIHFYGSDWGIYVYSECIRQVGSDIGRWLPRGTLWTPRLGMELQLAAFLTFYLHEAFHHKTEALAIRYQITRMASHYYDYWDAVYMPPHRRGHGPLEEALANVDSYRRLAQSPYRDVLSTPVYKAARNYLKWRFRHDPPGYRDATTLLNGKKGEAALNLLKAQVMDAVTSPATTSIDRGWDCAPNMNESLFGIDSNIYQIVPKSGSYCLPPSGATRPTAGSPISRTP